MIEILNEFKDEVNDLTNNLKNILENIENDFKSKNKLNDFAQIIDRIMGSAKTLVSFGFDKYEIKKLGDFAELCKQIGYKAANLEDEALYDITIAFLFDSVESMKKLLITIDEEKKIKNFDDVFLSTYINRLKWILKQFQSKNIKGTNYCGINTQNIKNQDEIDSIIEALSNKK